MSLTCVTSYSYIWPDSIQYYNHDLHALYVAKPNMLRILPILPSKKLPIILILFSYHYLLFPYYSFVLMFQVHIYI